MPDIFLSYSRDDQATARRFAEAFERAGFSVWWDATLRSGEAYDQVTEKALKEARAVVVLWSRKSVESRWVRAEATLAERNKALVPVMIEPCERPIMFELTHTADLVAWSGDLQDRAWQSYLADVRRFVEARPIVESPARETAGTTNLPAERLPSIAVLPFSNMSGEKEQEYFSDGLAEEIINALAQIPGLKVIARTSAFAFKGQNTDIRRIAATLGVTNVLEGSVRRSGNRVRVTAQLIAATDGTHLWSERYDRELADVFAVQDEISRAIAEALKVKLSPQAAARPRHTPALPAYEALLKARHLHWRVTAESMEQAGLFYEKAIALDPQFALAHDEYAEYLFGRTSVGMSSLREVVHASRALALRSLELDPFLADAHGCLCLLAAAHDYDWKEARRQFLLATPGGRGSPLTHFGCGWVYLLGSGRRDEAVEQLQLAVQEDPLHLTYRSLLGQALGAAGRLAEAESLLLQTWELDPDFVFTNAYLADHYAHRRMFAEALPFAARAFSVAPWFFQNVGVYAALLDRLGQPERAKEVLHTLAPGAPNGTSKALALFHEICGDLDQAAGWYEKAIDERDSVVAIILQSAAGEALRASRHWPKLAALMNLSDARP